MAVLTTGGTYSYQQSAIQIITAALRICQVLGEEETASGAQLQTGMDALNAMVKAAQASGIHVWCEEECILFPQPGQVQYQIGAGSPDHFTLYPSLLQTTLAATVAAGGTSLTLTSATNVNAGDQIGVQLDAGTNFWTTVSGTPVSSVVGLSSPMPSQASVGAIAFDYATPLVRPLRVMGGRRYLYSSKIETPMIGMSRLDYGNMPNKYNQGTITQYFFDPQTGQGAYAAPTALLNLWPSPADYTFGFRFTAQRPIQEFSTLANIPDFPVEWTAALKWNLALELAPEYGVPPQMIEATIAPQATKWFTMAQGWDREPEPILFGVAFEPGYRAG